MSRRLQNIRNSRHHSADDSKHHKQYPSSSCCDPCVQYEDDCADCREFYRNYHCPPRRQFNYLKTWTICAEADFKKGDDLFAKIFIDDPDMCCLKYLLRYDQCAIDEHIGNAVIFFKKYAGIDFSNSQYDKVNGEWRAGDFVMKPYYIHRRIGMSLIKDDGSIRGKVHKCGFMVYALRDTMIGGEWGGEEGMMLQAGSTMEFGLWIIEDHDGVYVIHGQSATPVGPRNNEVYPIFERLAYLDQTCHKSRGMWGMVKGSSFTIESCNMCPHFCLRAVITMDAVPDCDPCETWCERERRTKGEESDDDEA